MFNNKIGGKFQGIKGLVEEFGAKNLRIFLNDTSGDPPFIGDREYVIIEDSDKVSDNYKIQLELVDKTGDKHFIQNSDYAPDWWVDSYFRRRMYIQDLNQWIFRERGRVYVLVDEDNKYERIW